MGGFETVGILLADIANTLLEGQRLLGLADKRHWDQDEHELLRALENALDEAKKDFQELSLLVKGQSQYEHDRSFDSLEELRPLRAKFDSHIQNIRDWSRSGGPVNGAWTHDTITLQKQLHRAQCRTARRVFTMTQESSKRCLGAFLVNRSLRRTRPVGTDEAEDNRKQLEETMICNTIGSFERFGDQDIAFICDFCDGHVVWEDLERVPTTRVAWDGSHTPPEGSLVDSAKEWQASGIAQSNQQVKEVVFAPTAVANHVPPLRGDWQAGLLCPLCEMEERIARDVDDEEDEYRTDSVFDELSALQEHLAWQHGTSAPGLQPTLPISVPSTKSCVLM